MKQFEDPASYNFIEITFWMFLILSCVFYYIEGLIMYKGSGFRALKHLGKTVFSARFWMPVLVVLAAFNVLSYIFYRLFIKK